MIVTLTMAVTATICHSNYATCVQVFLNKLSEFTCRYILLIGDLYNTKRLHLPFCSPAKKIWPITLYT